MSDRVYQSGQRYRAKKDNRVGKLLGVTFAPSYEMVSLIFEDHPQRMTLLDHEVEIAAVDPIVEATTNA